MRGRELEWQAVTDLLQRARQGGGGVLLVEGEPGMGKSQLLGEAAQAASSDGFVVAAGAADELTRFVPGGPLLAALRHLTEAGPRGAGRLTADENPLALVDALGQRLEASAHARPVLVCVDDLHWADRVTLLALRLLPSRLARCPMGWILARSCARRDGREGVLFDLLASEGAARVRLPPLRGEAVAGLIADATGGEPDQVLLELASAAAGNPSLITEIVTGLLDDNGLILERGRATVRDRSILPERTRAVIRGRFDRLGGRARQLVQAAAVLGRSFRVEDVAVMLGSSAAELLPAVEEALAVGVIVATPDTLSFHDTLLWQAVVDGLAAPVRRALHSEFGNILLSRGSALQAAPHLVEAAVSDEPAALARLDHVRAAVLPVSPDAAADVAVRALELTRRDDPGRLARSAGAAEALAAAGRLDAADRVIREVLAQPMSGPEDARLRGALASVLHLQGLDEQACTEAERALAEPRLPEGVRASATIALLQALASMRDNRRGTDLAARIVGSADGHPRTVQVAALIVLGVIRWDEGRMVESLALCRDAILLGCAGPPDVRLAQARLTLAGLLIDVRRFDEAATLLQQVREWYCRPSDLDATATPALLRARMALGQGRLDEAVAEVEIARRLADARGAHAYRAHAFNILVTVGLRRGYLDGAAAWAPGPAHPHLAASGGQLRNRVSAAQLAEARGGPAAAMHLLHDAWDALAEHRSPLVSEPYTAPWLVRIALGTGERKFAERAAQVADDIARTNPGFPTVSAAAEHALGILGKDPARLRRAFALHEDPWVRASAAEDLGILLTPDDGARVETVACLDDALAGYESSGAVRDVARVRRRLRGLGVRRRHWAAHRRPEVGWDALTDTERAISELVSRGLSNQEVADLKYVSVHTVAFHLRQVFRKLGITSRVELARLAVERVPGEPANAR